LIYAQHEVVMVFSAAETACCRRLIDMALEEDLGSTGDLTSRTIIPKDLAGRAVFVARAAGVVAGLPAVEMVLQTVHTPLLKFEAIIADGARVTPGDRLATVSGLMEFILTAERTALNFLQHLSGIATLTRQYVDAIAGLPCQILDTRKTLPGWRLLEKYAVRCGGAHNHRMGLYDGMFVKDNHLAALGGSIGAFRHLYRIRGQKECSAVPWEIEIDTPGQLGLALGLRPDVILLDNMPIPWLHKSVKLRNSWKPRIQLEASGGVTLDTVRAIAETGVDRISVGALTYSAPALDIALDYEELKNNN
jgi:nicotinate-nucleotide pyrophosphorylase (carboxylating)